MGNRKKTNRLEDTRLRKMAEFDRNVKAIEIHVIIGCADSRDLSEGFIGALEKVKNDMRSRGILVDDQRLAVAGTFITPEIVNELKTLTFQKMSEYFDYRKAGIPIEFYFHINAHGDAHLKDGAERYEHSPHNIEITKGAKTNCGMMHADVVAKEIEQLLLQAKPVLGNGMGIKNQEDVKGLLLDYYGFDGDSVLSWVKPITDLAVHPLNQKEELRKNFDADPVMRRLRPHITAGVQNYGTNEYLRVDSNTQEHMKVTFLDRVYEQVRKNGKTRDHEGRVTAQKPTLGLFHQTSIHDARKTSYELIRGEPHGAGKVFGMGIGDKTAIQDFRPFDRYQIAGFFYGIVHLGIKEWVVMGKNQKETDKMAARIDNDPLMAFFVKHFDVKITRLSLDKAISQSISVEGKKPAKIRT